MNEPQDLPLVNVELPLAAIVTVENNLPDNLENPYEISRNSEHVLMPVMFAARLASPGVDATTLENIRQHLSTAVIDVKLNPIVLTHLLLAVPPKTFSADAEASLVNSFNEIPASAFPTCIVATIGCMRKRFSANMMEALRGKIASLPCEDLIAVHASIGKCGVQSCIESILASALKVKCFECPICTEWRPLSSKISCEMQHVWCRQCNQQWLSQPQMLNQIIAQRSLSVECMHARSQNCQARLEDTVLLEEGTCACQSRLACACDPLSRICKDFERRRQLISRANGRQCIECPRPNCVGIAYSGSHKRMCFICEHQWNSRLDYAFHAFILASALTVGYVHWLFGPMTMLAILFLIAVARTYCARRCFEQCTRCPQCACQIEKNGGCDHMTCRCGYEFSWTVGLPWWLAVWMLTNAHNAHESTVWRVLGRLFAPLTSMVVTIDVLLFRAKRVMSRRNGQ